MGAEDNTELVQVQEFAAGSVEVGLFAPKHAPSHVTRRQIGDGERHLGEC